MAVWMPAQKGGRDIYLVEYIQKEGFPKMCHMDKDFCHFSLYVLIMNSSFPHKIQVMETSLIVHWKEIWLLILVES